MSKPHIDLLKEYLHYDEGTGIFTWLRSTTNSVNVGDVAGCAHKKGYTYIMFANKQYRAHRLAWFYVYGIWPTDQIDHINSVRGDNRISNLREATRQENTRHAPVRKHTASGYKGVYKNGNKWMAQIKMDTKTKKYLGNFDTPEEAYEVYKVAAFDLHKEFLHRSIK